MTALALLLTAASPAFGQSFVSAYSISEPTFVALDKVGTTTYLYVSSHGDSFGAPPPNGGNIYKIDVATGASTVIATRGTADGQFISPDAIVVDPATHNLFIADRYLDRVQEITNTGTFVMKWGSGTAGAPDEMHGPVGLARDSSGAIYVSEHGEMNTSTPGDSVSKFTIDNTAHTATRVWRHQNGLATVYSVAVNGSQLYVSDGQNSRVQVWDLNGTPQGSWNVASGTIPLGLYFDSAGGLWLAESNASYTSGGVNQVAKLNATTGASAGMTVGTWGTGPLQFQLPFDAAIDSATNYAYIADYANNRVQVINLSGTAPTGSAPSITSNGSQSGTVGVNFRYQIVATNTPTSYTNLDALPAGLTLDSSSGVIAGIPSAATPGTNVRLTATNAYGTSAPFTLQITIAAAATGGTPAAPVGPAITSFALDPASVVRGVKADMIVTFDTAVTGVDATDFQPNTQNSATASVTGVDPISTSSYRVHFNYTDNNGSIQMAIKTSGTGITDGSSNAFRGAGITASPVYGTGATNASDVTAPTATVTAGTPSGNNVTFTVTFSEPVTGVDASDFIITGTSGTIGTVSGSGTTYTVPVTASGSGTVTLNSIGGWTANIHDLATNVYAGNSSASATIAGSSGGGTTDTTPPIVSSFTVGTNSGSTVNFNLVFSENVTGVDRTDFTVGGTGATGATVGAVTGSGTTYTVPVTYTATSGTVNVGLKSSGTGIADTAGNALSAGATSTNYTIVSSGGGGGTTDTTPPTVATFTVGANSGTTVAFNLTFSENVTGVDSTDFTVGGTGAAGATIGAVTGSGTSYTVPVTYAATSGTVNVALKSSGTGIADTAGNALAAGATSSSYTIVTSGGGGGTTDTTPPSVASFTVGSNSGTTVTYNLAFSENVTGVDSTDFTVGGTGAAGATIGAVTGSGTTYTVPVTYTATSGTVNLALKSSGTGIADTAGNALATGATSGSYTIVTSGGGGGTSSGVPVVTSMSVNGTVGVAIQPFTVSATNNPTEFTLNYQPNGIVINSTTGVVSGTPTVSGIYLAQVTAKNNAGASGPGTITFNIAQSSTGGGGSGGGSSGGGGGGGVVKQSQTIVFNSPVSNVFVGDSFTLAGQDSAGLPITYSVLSGNATLSGNTLLVTGAGAVVVRAMQAGNATYLPASADVTINVAKRAQQISIPATAAVHTDAGYTLPSTSSSGLPISYKVISGPATIDGNTVTFTGSGTVVVQAAQDGNSQYAGTTSTLTLSGTPVPRLVNISSRLMVSKGDANGASIAGFVVTGTAPKQILIRAVGPTLSNYKLASPLADPTLKLYDAKGNVVATNSGWNNDAAVKAAGDGVGAFDLTAGSKDAAILATLQPGAYTVQVQSADSSGTVLIEVYDVSANAPVPTKQLINISTRGYVGSGDNVLIGGFAVSGDEPKQVLVRAIGPTLSTFNVGGALSDPILTIYDAKGNAVAKNDNWGTGLQVAGETPATGAQISAADTATGAFALPAGSKDAAVVVMLQPGQYTAIVTGANGATGAAMVEVYEIPNP